MCIRDRHYHALFAIGIVLFLLTLAFNTVSYTHRDVYKRQPFSVSADVGSEMQTDMT